MKPESAVLLSQLQATHATLHAAVVQLGAAILALSTAIERDEAEPGENKPRCPECGRVDNILPCGVGFEGGTIAFVCPCGKNFTVQEDRCSAS